MAKTLNSVILEGYYAKDASVTMAGDAKKCEFVLAVNHGNDKVSYVTVAAWGNLVEVASRMAYKGNHVIVVGELYIDNWKSGDQWRNKTYVKAREIRLLDPKKTEEPVTTDDEEEVEIEFPWPVSDELPY